MPSATAVKIQPEVQCAFALQPLDNELEHRVLRALEEPASHGPYLPALEKLNQLVRVVSSTLQPHAKTNVLFLSDGRPSDQVDERELPRLLRAKLEALYNGTPRHERLQLLGFGDVDANVLRKMAHAMPGGIATFDVVSGSDGFTSLAQSVSTFSTSVTVSRISSVSHVQGPAKPLRRLNLEKARMALYRDCEIQLPPPKLGDFDSPLKALRGLHDMEISTVLHGHGGERNAYVMRFCHDNKFTTKDEEWVVKEGRHERSEAEEEAFHRRALVTQSAAKELATKVRRLVAVPAGSLPLPSPHSLWWPARAPQLRLLTRRAHRGQFNLEAEVLGLTGMPKVSYMTCCFIQTGQMERRPGEAPDPEERAVRSLFAERYIDGEFRKWNTNFGAVRWPVSIPLPLGHDGAQEPDLFRASHCRSKPELTRSRLPAADRANGGAGGRAR